MFACFHLYFSFILVFSTPSSYFLSPLPLIIIYTTCISLSLRRTSAPIHLTSVLGVLGIQETSCILIAGLLEREYLWPLPSWVRQTLGNPLKGNLLLFYKPLHLEAQQLSTRIEVRRHQAIFWYRCRGGKVKGTHILRCECSKFSPLDSTVLSFCFLFSLVRLNGKQQQN